MADDKKSIPDPKNGDELPRLGNMTPVKTDPSVQDQPATIKRA